VENGREAKTHHTKDHSRYPVNSLTAIGGHDCQLFDKLLWGLVASTIFVRY
jgi:hypothetical protein